MNRLALSVGLWALVALLTLVWIPTALLARFAEFVVEAEARLFWRAIMPIRFRVRDLWRRLPETPRPGAAS